MARIITIANQKGGVGKTTTTAALADGLKQKGFRVLLIDLDGQGNLSYTARANTTELTSFEVLHGLATAKQAIQHTEAGEIIAASPNLAGSDKDLTGAGADKRLKEALEPIGSEYDFIIIDAPPSLSILTVNAITAADSLIITAQADIYSLQGIGQLYATIRAIQQTTNKSLNIAGILLTRYNARSILTRDLTEIAEQTAAQLKTKIFKAKIREGIAVKEAQASGQSVITYSPKSNPAKDYSDFIKEFLEVILLNDETIKSLTDNEIEFMEILRTAENPEEAVKIAFEILKQMLDENSITSKLLKLIMGRYSSIAEFAKAIKMSEEATADIINGRAEPTLDEVIIIAKALNKEPEEIAEIFIDHHSKQKTTTPNQKENLHFNDYVKKTKKGSKEKCRLRIGDLTAKMRL